MDADRFDALLRSLSATPSRRGAMRLLTALSLSLLAPLHPEPAWAESGKCKPACGECQNCRKGKCEKKNGKKRCKKGKCQPKGDGTACVGGTCQGGTCVPTPPPPPFCAGKNSCQEGNAVTTCQQPGGEACVCVGTADTGAPFCALNSDLGTVDCSADLSCPAGRTCVNLNGGACDPPTGPGGLRCALPCPQPL